MDSAVVWPDSGMEFVNLSLFFLKNRLPSYSEPRSREEEQTEGGERWASRSGRKYTSSPVAQGTMKRVKYRGGGGGVGGVVSGSVPWGVAFEMSHKNPEALG